MSDTLVVLSSDADPVGMGLFFYPRGGSAQVAGYLSRALVGHGWHVTLACGSLGGSGALGNAATVFSGLEIVPAAYDDAVARWQRGEDPMNAPFPMHPSFEARAGVPDRGFPWVSPAQCQRMAAAWASLIRGSGGMSRARLLHLHHLTPIHDAVESALPGVPVVTHLHGTELKMLDAIAGGNPEISEGRHAQWWASQMRDAARRAVATITISPYDRGEAVRLLGLDPASVCCIPNGVDVERFTAHRPSRKERRSNWLRWLVCDPQGWDEATATPGSVRYAEDEVLDAFFDATSGQPRPVLMFVGRFLAFKRLPLLVRAYARARERMSIPAPLVIWGGVPGEWEGEHPHTVATRERVDGVFFSGWRGHDQLPLGLNCADCFVAPSTNEPFGLVYLEAMACQLPVIGTLSGGPPSFINIMPGEPDGWLVPPDDETALTNAIVTAIDTPAQRTQRGTNANRHARENYSWHHVASQVVEIYESHATQTSHQPG
jgi:glycosyltransferase involved in cell wall biosynthesis